MRTLPVSTRVHRIASIVAFALLAASGCTRRNSRDSALAPSIPAQVLAIADTAETWVGDKAPPERPDGLTLTVLWSATDPACLETMPTVEAWHEAFSQFGLHVVGLVFEREPSLADSLTAAVAARRLGLRFPSAVSQEPLPAALAGGRGPVVLLRGGPQSPPRWLGSADAASAVERELHASLRAQHPEMRFPGDPVAPPPADTGAEASDSSPRWQRVGLAPREVRSGPLAAATLDQPQPFTAQFRFQEESANLVPVPLGWWTPHRDGLEAARPGAANLIAIRYDAGPVALVMAPPARGASRVWVLQDERWIAAGDAGEDIRFDSKGAAFVEVAEPRLYWITRGGRHVLKLSPDDPGIRFHAFYFGRAGARP
jgi:hypothetical protein